MKREPWKDLTYAQIADVLERDGCSLCRLRDLAVYRYLYGILYEHTNDPGIRETLRKARGFCWRHTWNLHDISLHDPLVHGVPVAILYEDLLGRELASLQGSQDRPDPANCPACEIELESDARYVERLRHLLRETEFRREWPGGTALCLPHYRAAAEGLDDRAARAFLAEREDAALRQLLGELREFLRKQDYRYREEPQGTEQDSWSRAIGMAVGLRLDPRPETPTHRRTRGPRTDRVDSDG